VISETKMAKRVFELVNKRAVENKTKFHTGGEAMERKGFTLIELMIVIAIIIILAAIAIPNYLRMTERAKVSAIESDMKAIATALETYNTDWTQYPDTNNNDNWALCKAELTGSSIDSTNPTLNVSGKTTVTGENGGIQYITPEAIAAFEKKVGGADNVTYTSDGGTYTLTATANIGGKTYIFTAKPGGEITVSQS
jgi:prepilin-type N-terminal cleavage/methylation domain-containing protein